MSIPPPQLPPAGWYPDSGGVGLRWWDGERWTEHVHPPILRSGTDQAPTSASAESSDRRVSGVLVIAIGLCLLIAVSIILRQPLLWIPILFGFGALLLKAFPQPTAFSHSLRIAKPINEARMRLEVTFVPTLLKRGFRFLYNQPTSVALQREYHSGAVYFICIVLFPIGLLALLSEKKQHAINISFFEQGDMTEVVFTGTASPRLRREVQGLSASTI